MTPQPRRAGRDDLAARAAAVTAHATPTPPLAEDTGASEPRPRGGAPAPRTRPVRITVDLAPVDHMRFKRWCDDVAPDVGVATVRASEVVRVLLAFLHERPELADDVVRELRTRRDI
ncbi:hypothetical protein FF36_06324 [Frankia torreyi]|uniref:Uncharacterized protein n=2 Tax=Frankia TaxID=1854 RepID=A0A0D8B531_9ACTN|nr:hypothetical protein [Frankia torreyi]AAL01645.1 unknown [Frankia sp.]KJE19398.1 hypothetical protein FF36_06324 [Frankia torreyi]CAC39347.1 hypothetical protein [Frankia sp. ArI3]